MRKTLASVRQKVNDAHGLLNQLEIQCKDRNMVIMFNALTFLQETEVIIEAILEKYGDALEEIELNFEETDK